MDMFPLQPLRVQVVVGSNGLRGNSGQLSCNVESEGAEILNVNTLALSQVVPKVLNMAEKFKVPMASTNIKRLRAYRNAPGLRISPTRLTDKRGGKAAERLEILFRELLNDFDDGGREVSNG